MPNQHTSNDGQAEEGSGRQPRKLAHTTLLADRGRKTLAKPTLLGAWVLTRKPKVGQGKASITLRPVDQKASVRLLSDLTPEQAEAREARNHQRSVMRTRGLIKDYAMEHRLCFMWTLTYPGAGVHEWAQMTQDVRAFQRTLAEKYPGMPYLIVPEWHPGGHGLHLHMAVGRWIPLQPRKGKPWTGREMRAMWPGGVKAPETRTRIPPEKCAGYIAKYVQKSLGDQKGAKRFYRPHGGNVTVVRDRFYSELEAYSYAVAFFGGQVPYEWDSRLAEDWDGPPVICLDWNRPPDWQPPRRGGQAPRS